MMASRSTDIAVWEHGMCDPSPHLRRSAVSYMHMVCVHVSDMCVLGLAPCVAVLAPIVYVLYSLHMGHFR